MKQYSVYTLALLAAVLTLAVSHTDAQISASELAGLKAIRDAFPSLNDPSPNSWSDDNLENCDGSLFTSSPNGALLSKLGCEIINGTRHPTYLYASLFALLCEFMLLTIVFALLELTAFSKPTKRPQSTKLLWQDLSISSLCTLLFHKTIVANRLQIDAFYHFTQYSNLLVLNDATTLVS